MKALTFILSVIILVYCQDSSKPSKKEAYSLLHTDTELISAIEHFSVLVNQDSLADNNNTPVLIHAVLSKNNCFITATRRHEQYHHAEIIGETECNGYRVIFHSDRTRLPSQVLRKVNMKETDYKKLQNYEPLIWSDGQLYDKDTYMVWFQIKNRAKLKFQAIVGRSPEEMLEWGIDIRERAKKIK